MRLNELRDNPGANKAPKRLGRGPGSGKGKTGGRGVKGQKSRSGVAIKGFEGGQMPIHMRLPKRGFNNPFSKDFNEVNLGRVQEAIDAGKLDPSKPVTAAALREAGVIRRDRDGVRLLGNGELKAKVAFEIAGASAGARKAVEAAGGSLKLPEGKDEAKSAKGKAKAEKDKSAKGKAAEGKSGDNEPATEKKAKPAKAKQETADEAEAEKPAKAKKPKKAAPDEGSED